MSEQLTPESAREALSTVAKMKGAGARRAVWPRWAYLLEAALFAIVTSSYGVLEMAGHDWAWAIIPTIVGVFMRFWFVKKFGAFVKQNWLDALVVAGTTISLIGAIYAAKSPGLEWIAIVIGLVEGVFLYGLTEARRASARRMDGQL